MGSEKQGKSQKRPKPAESSIPRALPPIPPPPIVPAGHSGGSSSASQTSKLPGGSSGVPPANPSASLPQESRNPPKAGNQRERHWNTVLRSGNPTRPSHFTSSRGGLAGASSAGNSSRGASSAGSSGSSPAAPAHSHLPLPQPSSGRQSGSPPMGAQDAQRMHLSCHLCGLRFSHRSQKTNHIQQAHNKKETFSCRFPGCSKRFAHRSSRSRHELAHTWPSGRRPGGD